MAWIDQPTAIKKQQAAQNILDPVAISNTSAQDIIKAQLREWGLDALAEWAWQRYKETGSMELVKMEMEDRPEYKTRFEGRLKLREQGISMSEAEQIQYEKQASQLMRQAGMPPQFYDSWQDFQTTIGGNVSLAELSQRVNDAFLKVATAPAEVRQAFGEYYGAYSDSALAAYALDATKAAPAIMSQVAAGEAGGYLAQQNIRIARSLAEHIATATNFQTDAIRRGAEQLGQFNAAGLFDARFGEFVASIDQGASAVFENNAEQQRTIQRTAESRAASTKGGEGFGMNRRGIGGLGAASDT